MLKALIKAMRPRQWTKNGFVFFGLIFDKQLFLVEPFLRTLAGFFLFCLISSAVYLFNDIADVEADRNHPEKKFRPIASGQLPVGVASGTAFILTVVSLALGYLLSPMFALILTAYLITNLLYSRWLKHVAILDVLIISSGFVFRVAAGVALITVERFSPWLYMITILFSLYIGLVKRRIEPACPGSQLASQGLRWIHHPTARPIHYHRLGDDCCCLFTVHVLRAEPPGESFDDADDSICGVWYLPLFAVDPDGTCRRLPR
jgi:hypothetical protein